MYMLGHMYRTLMGVLHSVITFCVIPGTWVFKMDVSI